MDKLQRNVILINVFSCLSTALLNKDEVVMHVKHQKKKASNRWDTLISQLIYNNTTKMSKADPEFNEMMYQSYDSIINSIVSDDEFIKNSSCLYAKLVFCNKEMLVLPKGTLIINMMKANNLLLGELVDIVNKDMVKIYLEELENLKEAIMKHA